VPPNLGWAANERAGPPPDTFGAQRRLINNRDGPLLFEAELVGVRRAEVLRDAGVAEALERIRLRPYSLPAPPVYGR